MTTINSIGVLANHYQNTQTYQGQASYNTYTPSFKGVRTAVNNPTVKKGLLASTAAFIVAIASKVGIDKVKFLGKNAEDINPELAKMLQEEKVCYKERDGECVSSAYNSRMILRIVEANEKDPAYAFSLAEFLKHERGLDGITPKDTDYMISRFKQNRERAQDLKYMTAADTARILKIDEKDPEILKIFDRKKLSLDTLENLSKAKQAYPASFDKMLHSELKITPSEMSDLAPVFEKKEETIKKLYTLAKENETYPKSREVAELVKLHEAESEKVENIVKKYKNISLDCIKKLKDIDDAEGKVLGYYRDYNQRIPSYPERAVLYAYRCNKYSAVLDNLTKDVEDSGKRFEINNKVIAELGKELDTTLPRIVADGRTDLAKDFDSLKNLSALYARYPDINITDKMLMLNNDSKVRIFDISKM